MIGIGIGLSRLWQRLFGQWVIDEASILQAPSEPAPPIVNDDRIEA
jgi:hypothetical protein